MAISSLFGSSSASQTTFRPLSLGADVLAGWYVARASAAAAAANGPRLSGASAGEYGKDKTEILAPWDPGAPPSPPDDLKRRALATGVFVDTEDLEGYSDVDAPAEQKQLFALHQALKKLQAVAAESADKTTSDFRRSFLDRRFAEGLAQVSDYLATSTFTGVKLVAGEERTTAQSSAAIPRGLDVFTTGVLHEGDYDAEVDAFQGARAFTITAKKSAGDVVVSLDLSEMGATPRSLDNVADYINTKLEAAGVVTRIKRVKIGEKNADGIIEGNRFGFEVDGVSTERLVFSAPGSETGALYLAGTSGRSTEEETTAGQLTKLADLGAAAPTTEASTRFETVESDAEANGLKITAARAGADGAIFVLGTSDLSPDGGPALRGSQDVVLAKYDSTGRRVWTRVLGAADTAEGHALAIGADGSVTVAGVLTGELGDTVDRGGKDGFVTRYDSDGVEQWTQRLGGLADDSVDALVVGSDGTAYLGGRTRGGLGETNAGGTDAFVRAVDSSGATLWTRQFGGAEDDRASAIALADDGALLVGSVEDGAGYLRKYSTADGTSAATWEYALGDLDSGSINAIHADASGIYLTGGARAGLSLPGSPVAQAGARDAFVIGLDDGASPTLRFETFLGSSAEDVARDIVVADGAVYVAGYTDGELPGGASQSGGRNAFAAKLDATTGGLDWTTQITGRGGASEGAGLVYASAGESDLDAFGLPNGELVYQDERTVAERTSARVGDSFTISVDGGHKRTITLEEGDTLRALAFKVTTALVLDGSASVLRDSSGDVLKIKPKPGVSIQLSAGPEGSDLLGALGLDPGVVAAPAESDAEGDKPVRTFALGLSHTLGVSSRTLADEAMKAIEKAMTTVRDAYRRLTRDPALDDLLSKKPMGTAPAYLLDKIASYQDALARLGGGSAGGFGF